MSTVSGPSQNFQTLAPSYAPLGKAAAGLESPENKDQTLPPVEETNASEKKRNQPKQKADTVAGDAHGGSGSDDQPEPEEEQQQVGALVAAEREALTHDAARLNAQTSIEIALQRAALQADHGKDADAHTVVDTHTAVDSFSAAAGHTLAPGTLFDQRS